MFDSSKRITIGLDISTQSFKLVQLKKRRKKISLVSLSRVNVPIGLVSSEGEVKDSKGLSQVIKQSLASLKGEKLKTNRVVCNLPEEKVFIRMIEMPKMKKEEVDKAVIWEAENHIPFNIENVYLDWQIIEPAKKNSAHLDVLIAAAPKILVEGYLKSLKDAGFQPVALEPESVALVRSLIKHNEAGGSTMIVDIGSNGINFVIFSASAIRFTSRVNIPGFSFNQIIMKKLKINAKEAEALKIQTGLDPKKEGNKVYKILEPIVDDLARKTQSYINFYIEHSVGSSDPNKTISQILLCGGESLLIDLPEYLASRINLPVKLGNPWINIYPFIPKKAKTMGLSYKESLIYATALGLALRELE